MKLKFFVTIIIILAVSFQHIQAQTPAVIKASLPSIEGWTLSAETEVFNPDNLFDRINGAAPLYLENNFREMTSVEYKKGEDYITIQVYRHATPEDAFGMYASERSPDLEFYAIGGEAQGDNENLYFFVDNLYVKMFATSSDDVSSLMRQIAQGFATKIDPKASYPPLVRAFPEEGKVPHSQAYITSSYIGHEFLKGAYTTDYTRDGKKIQLFVIDAKTTEEAKGMLEKYMAFNKQPLDFKEGELTVKDRYNGDIPIIWKGRNIIGSFSENGEQPADVFTLLRRISERL